MSAAGIDRAQTDITNVVTHFKFEEHGNPANMHAAELEPFSRFRSCRARGSGLSNVRSVIPSPQQ
jgi:hypothetical protein